MDVNARSNMNQTALITHPKAASKEEDIAEAVEAWESMINWMSSCMQVSISTS